MIKKIFKCILLSSCFSLIISSFSLYATESGSESHKDGRVKLLVGENTTKQFPSVIEIAIVYRSQTVEFENQCSASVVSDKDVLTAGHCVFNNFDGAKLQAVRFNNIESTKIYQSPDVGQDEAISKDKQNSSEIESYFAASDLAVISFPEGTFKKYKKMKVDSNLSMEEEEPLIAVGIHKEPSHSIKTIVNYDKFGVYVSKIRRGIDIKLNFPRYVMLLDSVLPYYPLAGQSGGAVVLKKDPDTLVGVFSRIVKGKDDDGKQVCYGIVTMLNHPLNLIFLRMLVEDKGVKIEGMSK